MSETIVFLGLLITLDREPAFEQGVVDGLIGGFGGFGGGRGGNQGPVVPPGRYRATIARVAGDKVTPVGAPQSVNVMPIELK